MILDKGKKEKDKRWVLAEKKSVSVTGVWADARCIVWSIYSNWSTKKFHPTATSGVLPCYSRPI